MQQRLVALLIAAGLAVLAVGGLLAAGSVPVPQSRISFQIVTGSTAGTFFPVGEAIAGLISHPPGVDRCDTNPVCGPAGLVVSARTSQGTADNVTEVNEGDAQSGLAQGDVVAAAVKGVAPFRKKATHIRVIASLYDEDLHLVVAANSPIRSAADLAGKRVARPNPGAGAGITLHELLTAYGVNEKSLKLVDGDEVVLMQQGKIDAFLTVGGAPLSGLAGLFSSGVARLVPIDGPARDRLVKTVPSLMPAVVAAGVYAGQGATQTVATRAVWIVRDSVPDDLVYGITKALLNPMNRDALAASHPSAREITLANAMTNLPAPLHPGAAKFYKSVGK